MSAKGEQVRLDAQGIHVLECLEACTRLKHLVCNQPETTKRVSKFTLTPRGLPMPRRYSRWAPSSCRVRSPHHRKWPEQPYQRPVVLSWRVSACQQHHAHQQLRRLPDTVEQMHASPVLLLCQDAKWVENVSGAPVLHQWFLSWKPQEAASHVNRFNPLPPDAVDLTAG